MNSTAQAGARASSSAPPRPVQVAQTNLAAAPADTVMLAEHDFLETGFLDLLEEIPDGARTLLVLNPPYGKRLTGGNTKQVFRGIGDAIRNHYQGAYAVIVPGLEVEKALSLSRDRKILFQNGGLRVAVIFHTDSRGEL